MGRLCAKPIFEKPNKKRIKTDPEAIRGSVNEALRGPVESDTASMRSILVVVKFVFRLCYRELSFHDYLYGITTKSFL